jgi:hypothetical protein
MNHPIFEAMFLRPFVFLAIWVLILYPARLSVQKFMKEGWLKRLLLRRIS